MIAAEGRPDPQLRPGAQGGLGLPYVRGVRVAVQVGSLVVHHPRRATRVVAGPGAIARVLLVEPALTQELISLPKHRRSRAADGLLVFLRADAEPVLAVLLAEWMPPGPLGGARDRRRASGGPAVAAALGLPIEPVEPRDAEQLRGTRPILRRVLLPATVPAHRLSHVSGPIGTAACAINLLSLGLHGTWLAPVLASVGVALAGLLVGVTWRLRTQAQVAAATPIPGTWGRVRARPTGGTRGGDSCQVLVSTGDVVVVDASGQEAWLPGPAARDGVTEMLLAPDAILLRTVDERTLAVLDPALWAGDPTELAGFANDARAAGLDVVALPLAAEISSPFGSAMMSKFPPVDRLSNPENGDLGVGAVWFSAVAALAGVANGIATLSLSVPVGVVLGAAAATVVAAASWLGGQRWRARRTYRRQSTGAAEPSSAAVR